MALFQLKALNPLMGSGPLGADPDGVAMNSVRLASGDMRFCRSVWRHWTVTKRFVEKHPNLWDSFTQSYGPSKRRSRGGPNRFARAVWLLGHHGTELKHRCCQGYSTMTPSCCLRERERQKKKRRTEWYRTHWVSLSVPTQTQSRLAVKSTRKTSQQK